MAREYGIGPMEHCGIPFGGLGTGSFELRADGHFYEWQIMNNHPWGHGPATTEMEDEGLFFGACANDGEKPRVLMPHRPKWGDFNPSLSWESLRWTCDPYHMPWMQYPRNISCEGRFPFANLACDAPGYPLSVELEAWSPFIPLDADNSGLPLAYLSFRVKNRSRKKQTVSLFGALKNAVGYDRPDKRSLISVKKAGRATYLDFTRDGLPEGHESAGSMGFGVWSKKKGRTSYVLHAVHPRDIYDPVMNTGRLEDLDRADFKGLVGNNLGGPAVKRDAVMGASRGVLCRTMDLEGGETAEVTFAITWFFPNQRQRTCTDGDETIGHWYANRFKSAGDVMEYAVAERARLEARTREFVDAYYDSSAEKWVLDAAAAQLTSFTKSTWWDAKGRFVMWEGLGCCGLHTPDITLYASFPVVQFFPEIQKRQMELLTVTAERDGRPPHSFPGTFATACLRKNRRIDNSPQYILMVWRDALWTGDLDYLKRVWPAVETFLADIEATDRNGDGLPDNAGVDQTYDQFPLYGTSAYVGFEYVGALKAASEMAAMLHLDERAAELKEKAAAALATLEDQLWNGEYYNLSYEVSTGEGNAGCMADQLCGDWFVRQTDGEGLVRLSRARKALKAAYKYCRRDEGYLANCDWPRGGRVPIRRETSDQANCPWSGVEFAVAAELILLGLQRQGLDVTRMVWDRYERFGMRYNHIECGAHYNRAMSSWAVYLALYGFAYNAPESVMRLRGADIKGRFVWNTPHAWGTVTFRAGGKRLVEIEVRQGRLPLKALELAGVEVESARARAAGKAAACSAAVEKDLTRITFKRKVSLRRGAKLSITV